MKRNDSVFETLFGVNVNDYVEKKPILPFVDSMLRLRLRKITQAHTIRYIFSLKKQLPYVFD